MNRIAGRAWVLLLLMAFLAGGLGFFGYEYVTKGETWVLHSGSPHVYEGGAQLIALGRVIDGDGEFLLDLNDGRTYASNPSVRMATVHWLGDRSGNIRGTVLQTYAAKMAGFSLVDGLYGYDGGGATAQLTLLSQVQAEALAALGSYKGTIAVYNYRTGQILCAVSTPVFDPEAVPDLSGGDYEGVYWNRFTQAAYVPGSIFKIVTTAAALEQDADVTQRTYTCTGKQVLRGGTVTCERPHGKQDLKAAMRNSCNCYYAQLTVEMGAEKLTDFVQRSGVLRSVSFDGVQTARGNFSVEGVAQVELAWAGIGQHTDLVNPCAFLRFVGAVANGGVAVSPYMMESVTAGKQLLYRAVAASGQAVMSRQTAEKLQEFMRNNVKNGYGDENFPEGMTVCAKSGTGEVDGDRRSYAMFTGFVVNEEYPLAFLAAVEDAGYGKQVCMPMISRVLAACKNVLDAQMGY